MHNFDEIQERIKIVEKAIQDKFPGCHFTTKILLWDDDTSLVQCTHGTGEEIHRYIFYNGELTYIVDADHDGIVMTEDEFGTEHLFELKDISNG